MNPQQNRTDVLVAGAGVIGLSCAWRALKRGMTVRVLERAEAPAAEASGVAAGMLAPVGEASWGEERLLSLGLASMRMWDGFAAELGEDSGLAPGYRRCGALHVALDRDEAAELKRRFDLHERLELGSEWLLPSACRALEPGLSPKVAGGLHAPHEGAADPVAVCAALAASIRGLGGEIEFGAEISSLSLDGGVSLETADRRTFAADRLVVAAGSWSGAANWLPDDLRPPVRPVKGEILTLRGQADEPVCEGIVAGERIYLVPREDGRLIAGATVDERGFDTTVTAGGVHELLREAYRVLPDIAELELVGVRAGLRPGSPDNAPLIGATADERVLLATGHHRNGILLAPVTGESVAALLAGEEPPADLGHFAPSRFAAEGGRVPVR